ncbi:unnamed protein product [Closterium sp. NIES-54]
MATVTVVAASGGGQQQQRQPETLSLQQLREWVIRRGRPGGGGYGAGGTGQQRQSRRQETRVSRDRFPPFASMLLCPDGDPDALDIPTLRSYAEAVMDEYSSQWQTAMDAEMASWISIGTYVDEVPPSWGEHNRWHVDFQSEAAAGFSSCLQGALRFSKLQTAIGGRLLPELLPHPKDDHSSGVTTRCSHPGQSTPHHQCEYHRIRFEFSSPQSTPLPTGQTLSAPPSDEPVEPSGQYPELVGCLMYLMTCTRPYLAYPLSILARYVAPGRHGQEHWQAAKRVLRYLCCTLGMGLVLGGRGLVVLTGHSDASWAEDQATQRSSQGYSFILGSNSISWRSTRLSSVLGSSSEAEIYARAMAAQELRWLTYLLTDLGERPRSPPVLYVDNKAMIALCQEQRLEHRMKHIALRYFLARELQQRGQVRLAYMASRANTADIFTKALGSGPTLPSQPPAFPLPSFPSPRPFRRCYLLSRYRDALVAVFSSPRPPRRSRRLPSHLSDAAVAAVHAAAANSPPPARSLSRPLIAASRAIAAAAHALLTATPRRHFPHRCRRGPVGAATRALLAMTPYRRFPRRRRHDPVAATARALLTVIPTLPLPALLPLRPRRHRRSLSPRRDPPSPPPLPARSLTRLPVAASRAIIATAPSSPPPALSSPRPSVAASRAVAATAPVTAAARALLTAAVLPPLSLSSLRPS